MVLSVCICSLHGCSRLLNLLILRSPGAIIIGHMCLHFYLSGCIQESHRHSILLLRYTEYLFLVALIAAVISWLACCQVIGSLGPSRAVCQGWAVSADEAAGLAVKEATQQITAGRGVVLPTG